MEQHHEKEMDQTDDAKPSEKQKALDGYFSNIVKEQNLWLALREDRLLGDALLVKWKSESLRPFKIVEDSCTCLNQWRSRYNLPSRNKQRQMMKLAAYIMKGVKEAIQKEMGHYSLTFDI